MLARDRVSRAAGLFAAWSLTTASVASADTFLRARVRVDASNPAAIAVTHSLDWNAEGGSPRSELAFYLASEFDVTGVRSEAATLTVRAEPVAGTTLRRWVLRLPVPLSAGATRPLVISAKAARASATGVLLPGSGWFPSISSNADELVPHTTEFVLREGQRGIGCGGPSGSAWTATQPGRPYALWGPYRFTSHTIDGESFTVWRKTETSGPPPRAGKLARLIQAFVTGLGEASGTGAWKIVDVGGDVISGGQRTLFWNEAKAAAEPDRITILDRDLGAGLAAAFWEEAMRFEGDYAVFASRGLSRHLGDATAATLDEGDARWKTEALFSKSRRAKFVASRSVDHTLRKLPLHSTATAAIVEGRAALVANLVAEACPGMTYWIRVVGDFRREHLARRASWEQLAEVLAKLYPNQHEFLAPFLDSKDVPDFVLGAHGPAAQGSTGQRYKIEVSNRGKIAGPVDVTTLTKDGHQVRTMRTLLEPGESKSILFGDARRIGQIRLDPRAMAPQYAFENEEATVSPPDADTTPFVPAFTISQASPLPRPATGLSLSLDGMQISDFSGMVFLYETHHGPTGAVLLGDATIEIAPTGPFVAPFRATMGKDRVTFRGHDLFVRFPLAAFSKLESQLGEPVAASPEINARRKSAFENSFLNGFNEDNRAQVPPPGAALVVFTLVDTTPAEWRAYIREPQPDGKVRSRVWDRLRRTTIWESTL